MTKKPDETILKLYDEIFPSALSLVLECDNMDSLLNKSKEIFPRIGKWSRLMGYRISLFSRNL